MPGCCEATLKLPGSYLWQAPVAQTYADAAALPRTGGTACAATRRRNRWRDIAVVVGRREDTGVIRNPLHAPDQPHRQ